LAIGRIGSWAGALEFYLTPWGFLKGAAEHNATAGRRRVDGRNYTVLTWSPAVKAPSGKSYTINGYVNDQNIVERVETWLGDNIMGDMHVLATYSGWKDFGGAMAPAKIVQTRGGWPFFDVDVTAARAVEIKSPLYNASTMISPDSAKIVALCAVPGQIGSGEMTLVDSRTHYDIDIIPNGMKTHTKVVVDAETGAVLSSKQFGGLRGLAGWVKESMDHKKNKTPH